MSSASAASLVRRAVHSERAAERSGWRERLFSTWFNRLVYTQIWEDPRVDAKALRLNDTSRILTISSAGCNVLNYLTHEPAHLLAVDVNPAHMALTRLKIAAMAHLPDYPAFYRFFGEANHASNVADYYTHIRPHLDDATCAFWEARPWPGWPRAPRIHYFAEGFYQRGAMSRFQAFVDRLAQYTVGRRPAELLNATTLADQKAFFREAVEPFFQHPVVRGLGRLPAAVYSLGIPPRQFDIMNEQGMVLAYYRDRLRRLMCQFPLSDNYFAWQAFGQRYHPSVVPPYLQARHYARIRYYLPHVETRVASLTQVLKAAPNDQFNCFVLLDAQDWMDNDAITELWQGIARVGLPGARIIFRSAGAASCVEQALPTSLRARFTYRRERSAQLHARDRSAVYGGFHLYVLDK